MCGDEEHPSLPGEHCTSLPGGHSECVDRVRFEIYSLDQVSFKKDLSTSVFYYSKRVMLKRKC